MQLLAPRLDQALVGEARAAYACSAARSSFFRPKARAISRMPALPVRADEGEESSSAGRGGLVGRGFLADFFFEMIARGRPGPRRSIASPDSFGAPVDGLRRGFAARPSSSASAAFLALAAAGFATRCRVGLRGVLRLRARLRAGRSRRAPRSARPPARA